MVELVGVMPGDVDEWPSDMDARVAALDFGGSDSLLSSAMMNSRRRGYDDDDEDEEDSSCCFDPSLSTFDPSLSTDSLDSEELRARCANKKDDYKLTFADSGQWTASQHFTTWGRIQHAQPLDDKIVSAPAASSSPTTPRTLPSVRPSSLLIDFVGRQLGGGLARVVDVNENDVTGAAPSSASEAAAVPLPSPSAGISDIAKVDRWQSRRQLRSSTSSSKMKRTFADLAEPPELRFLALPHEMRALVDSAASPEALAGCSRPSLNLSDMAPPQVECSPDSGLGCSGGPVHIEDWASLSILLPRHVAEACSFFKRNSELLTGSSSNCVERRSPRAVAASSSASGAALSEACTTCFRLRRHRFHPPVWAHSAATRQLLCDCAVSTASECTSRAAASSAASSLRSRELAVVGLPVYASARRLVEEVVEAVAVSVRREGDDALIEALTALLSDGLKTPHHPWNLITAITAPGPATYAIHSMVKELDESERSDDARVQVFLSELVAESSAESWLCYVLLKENVLHRFYRPCAFVLSAPSAYRSLLARLLDSLRLLGVHEQREQRRSGWGGACRLAADSRVPKSSSVPARLSASASSGAVAARRPSRLPLPRRRLTAPWRSSLSGSTETREARVRADSAEPGLLAVRQGERVRVLSTRGSLAHCCRLRPSPSDVSIGRVPLNNLLLTQ